MTKHSTTVIKIGYSTLEKGLAVFAVISILAAVYMFAGPVTQEFPPPDGDGVVACRGGETQSLDANAFDIDAPTTALTEAHNIIREYGSFGSLGTWTQGTALTGLKAGGSYELLSGVDATAGNRYDNAYGPAIRIDKLPCVTSMNIPFFQDELEGSLTATFYNSNHDASIETIVASTPVIVYTKWYGADKEYYGNPYIGPADYIGASFTPPGGAAYMRGLRLGNHRPEYPNTYCVQLNTTDFNAPKWVKVQLQNGLVVEMNRVSVPVSHSASASNKDYCYEAPIVSGTAVEFQLKLDPKAVVAEVNGTASLYAASWYTDTDTGELTWGTEDNDGAAIAASGPDTVPLHFYT